MKEREGGKEEEEMEQKKTWVTMCQPKIILCSNSISYAICSHHWDINSQRQGFFLEGGSGVSQWCFQVLEKSAWCQKNVANICWINTVILQNNNAWHSLRTFTALGPGLMFLLAECSVTCMSLQALFHPISQQCCNTFNEYILKIKRMNVRETNTVI